MQIYVSLRLLLLVSFIYFINNFYSGHFTWNIDSFDIILVKSSVIINTQIIDLLLGNQLLMGWLTLLVIFLGMILCLVIEIRRRSILREINCRLDRRSVLAFIFYTLFYAFILAPYCLIGYISELFNYKKKWQSLILFDIFFVFNIL